MSLWTKRHAIPELFSSHTVARSTVVGGKIWTLCEIMDEDDVDNQSQLYVFDPVSEVFTKVNCVYPANWPEMYFLSAHDNYLYIWRGTDFREDTDRHLYRLNVATLEWEYIMTIHRVDSIFTSVIINEQVMYALEADFLSKEITLISIDLPKKEVIDIQQLTLFDREWNFFLSTHNDKLYLIKACNGCRKVSEVKNGMLIEVAQEEVDQYERANAVHCTHLNECLAFTSKYDKFVLRSFDFELLKWTAEVTTGDWLVQGNFIRIQNVVKSNRSIYVLGVIRCGEEREFELYKLDLHPNLSSICLVSLSEESDKEKLKVVKQQLPIPLRVELKELIEWKTNPLL